MSSSPDSEPLESKTPPQDAASRCIRAGDASDGSGAGFARQESPSSTQANKQASQPLSKHCAVWQIAPPLPPPLGWEWHGMARHGCHAMHHQLSAAGMPDASVWLVDCCSGPVAGDAEPFAFLLLLFAFSMLYRRCRKPCTAQDR
ncbi:hypothetical protein CFIO01_10344 [Colletotrichum fioriniae PJ7]|uniref:Uncharacterized protein n=1 Tax=Colletotrichum fioriniae PJ7 TaxID=1445577 RepID=A0A010Q481_9PEZI|nr:hypothetical protein CFIO01_10344 [Colletotrichum fioriniae PJ7]